MADPERFDADPDPSFHADADPDPKFSLTPRIVLFCKILEKIVEDSEEILNKIKPLLRGPDGLISREKKWLGQNVMTLSLLHTRVHSTVHSNVAHAECSKRLQLVDAYRICSYLFYAHLKLLGDSCFRGPPDKLYCRGPQINYCRGPQINDCRGPRINYCRGPQINYE